MGVYLSLLLAPIIIHIISSAIPFADKKKVEIILDSVLLILFLGLRNENVGADTIRYINHFHEICSYGVGEAIQRSISHESPLYVFLAWLVSRVTKSEVVFFFVVAIIHFCSFARFVYKRSVNVCLSYYIYIALFLALQLSSIKNCLAVAVLFWGLDSALDRNLKGFLISLVIAVLFHRTTLVFLIVYPLINIRQLRLTTARYIVIFAICFVFRVQLSSVLKAIGGYSDYMVNQASPWMMTLLCILFVLFPVFMRKKNIKDASAVDEYNKLIIVSMLASIFMALVFVNPSALRVVRYFLIAATILIPQAFKNLELSQRKRQHVLIAIIPFYVILGYQFLQTVSFSVVYQYSFFWQ